MKDETWDVAIVGQGVVGQLLSVLLARAGHSVVALERHEEPYSLPRAVHYTADVSRILSGAGIDRQRQAQFGVASESYDWLTADGELMLTFPSPVEGEQAWPDATMFNQPGLESALAEQQELLAAVAIRRGAEVIGVDEAQDAVTVTVKTEHGIEEVRARYVVGCDGANSFVREAVGLSHTDLGFTSDFLVMDLLVPEELREWSPTDAQICDPKRPTSAVSGGPGRRRFEFMLMPGEPREASEDAAWALAAPWGLSDKNCTLERLAIYTFRARCAEKWRRGRVLIAGDAAHQMPPFYGVGMVSGIRDAANLWWKLDQVLRGVAPDRFLDTYETERYAHVQYALGMSVELGRVICETDADAVRERNAHFLTNGPLPWNVLPPVPPEMLGPGYFPGGAPGDDPVSGRIGIQGRVRRTDGSTYLPDEESFGAALVVLDGRAFSADDITAVRSAIPDDIRSHVLVVVPEQAARPEPGTVADLDNRYLPFLESAGAIAAVFRPDFYGFGCARTVEQAGCLVAHLTPAAIAAA